MLADLIARLRQDRFAVFCVLVLLVVLAAGLLAPWIAPNSPTETAVRLKYQSSSWAFPLGTDNLGRCTFSRLLFGIRTTVFYALAAMALTLSLGVLIGLIAGVMRGIVDAVLMRLCDVMLAFPAEVMILALVGVLGPGIDNILIAIVVVKWAWYARMIRGTVVQYTHQNYVRYAQVIGAPAQHVLRRHLLPMTATDVAILASADIGSVILLISALSFLGLGVQPPTPEWGSMLSEAKDIMLVRPQQMLPAGLTIVLVVVAFNGLGDFLRDVLDPGRRTRRPGKASPALPPAAPRA